MLQIEIRAIGDRGKPTVGVVPADDPLFEDAAVKLLGPVSVDGQIRAMQQGNLHWSASLNGLVGGECRRCLGPVRARIDDLVEVIFSDDPELLEDPSVYRLPPGNERLDLRPAIREELLLRAPAFPLCREACKGLCQRCGADLNTGPCHCTGPEPTSRG